MSEKNINEKIENKEVKTGKEERKQGLFAKLKPLAEEAMVGVASGILILGSSCTAKFIPPKEDIDAEIEEVTEEDFDAKIEEEREDIVTEPDTEVEEVEEIEEDAEEEEDEAVEIVEDEVSPEVEEDATTDAEIEEDAEEEIAEEEDATTDPDAEVEVQDATEDVISDDMVAEDTTADDVEAVCSAYDEMRYVWISVGNVEVVGGIGIRYNGRDASGRGIYDIVCGDVTVRSGITIAALSSQTVDVSEYNFGVTIRPNSIEATRTNVTITVNAY